ncbi:hypothetical protein V8F06_013833 [Rhypophila decipiens]
MARIRAVESRQRFGLLTLLYIAFLVVPWILTCLQARKPFLLTKLLTRSKFDYDFEVHGIQRADADHATRFTYVLNAISYLAAVVALPVLYEILARATVIYTLRTGKLKKLTTAQAFALADRRFLLGCLQDRPRPGFFFFSGLLILLTVAYHVSRGAVLSTTLNRYSLVVIGSYGNSPKLSKSYPNSWDVDQIGASPAPDDIQALPATNVMTKLRQAIIATHPDEWQQDAWFAYRLGDWGRSSWAGDKARFFATSLKRNTTTGLVRNLALRMDSEFECGGLGGYSEPWYPEDCPSGEAYPFRHPRLELDICIQGNGTGSRDGKHVSPWTNTTDTQVITEQIYVRMPDFEVNNNYEGELQRDFWDWDRDYHCNVTTRLGFFVLGNDMNNNDFSPRLERLNESDTEIVARERAYASHSYSDPEDRRADDAPVPGPLTLAARAMFGGGSFYDISQRIADDVPDRATYSAMLSASCPFPLQRHPKLQYNCGDASRRDDESIAWGASGVVRFIKALLPGEGLPDYYTRDRTTEGRQLLDSTLYLANKAVMDLAIVNLDDTGARTPERLGIFHTEGVAVRQFDMTDSVIAAMSALLGLQVLAILALLFYTLRLPAWTETLDAFAVARMANQFKDGNLLRTIGLRKPTESEIKKLSEIDALVGIVESIPLSDMSSTAAATTRASGSGDHGPGRSSPTDTSDAHSHQSQPQIVPVVSNDPQMGMGTIPIDVQTVISEDLDTNNNNNNNNNNNTNANNNDRHGTDITNLDAPAPPTGANGSGPRISLNIADIDPDHDNHAGGSSSPPAYTPRTGQPEPNLMPPSYASALAVNGLRVGAPGLVTRKNIPTALDDVWA